MKKHTLLFFTVLFGLILAILGLRIHNDTWYLLALGRAIAADGLTLEDPILMNLGYPIVDQQWLYALGLWKVFSLSGLWGIYVLSVVAGFLTIILFYRIACLLSEKNDMIPYLLTTIVGLLYGYLDIVIRPWVFSNLFFMVEVYLLEHYVREKKVNLLLPLPFLSVLLINIHGALWPFMLILLLPYLAEALLPECEFSFCLPARGFPKSPLVLCFFTCLLFGFINPYGLDLMLYSIHTMGIGRSFQLVTEVRPFSIQSYFGVFTLFVAGWLFFCLSRQKTYVRYLLLSLGTFFMMLIALRSRQQFLLFGCLPLAWLCRGFSLTQARAFLRHHIDPVIFSMFSLLLLFLEIINIHNMHMLRHFSTGLLIPACLLGAALFLISLCFFYQHLFSFRWKVVCLLTCIFFGLLPLAAAPGFDMTRITDSKNNAEFSFLRHEMSRNPAEVRLYTDFNSSAMAEYIGFRPLIDTRPEVRAGFMTHGFDYWQEFYDVQTGSLDPLTYLDKYSIEYVLVRDNDICYSYLNRPEAKAFWSLIYDKYGCRIYKRTQKQRAAEIASTETSDNRW